MINKTLAIDYNITYFSWVISCFIFHVFWLGSYCSCYHYNVKYTVSQKYHRHYRL